MMRNTLPALLFSVLATGGLVAGCEGPADPARQAAKDAHDVAMVERMNREPMRPLVPVPISAQDITGHGLDRPGCKFRRKAGEGPLFIAGAADGYLYLDGELRRYAAKTDSAELPEGARSKYVGLASWIDIARLPENERDDSAGEAAWPARLVIHDAQERIVFTAEGVVGCQG